MAGNQIVGLIAKVCNISILWLVTNNQPSLHNFAGFINEHGQDKSCERTKMIETPPRGPERKREFVIGYKEAHEASIKQGAKSKYKSSNNRSKTPRECE